MGNWLPSFFVVLAFVLIAILIRRYVLFITRVFSRSMLPNYRPDDRLLTICVHRPDQLKRGDVVVFRSDEHGKTMVKRLIGLPGDKVLITETGNLFINGYKQDEAYVAYRGGLEGSFMVPEGEFFFLGDNREESIDSRHWMKTAIPFNKIQGKVVLSLQKVQIRERRL